MPRANPGRSRVPHSGQHTPATFSERLSLGYLPPRPEVRVSDARPGIRGQKSRLSAAGSVGSSRAQVPHFSASGEDKIFGATSSWGQAEARLSLESHLCLALPHPPAAHTPSQMSPECAPFTNCLQTDPYLRFYFGAKSKRVPGNHLLLLY